MPNNPAPRDQIVASTRALLAYRGKSAADAAEALGISRSSMYERLAGAVDFSATDIARLAEMLDAPVAWIYEGLPQPARSDRASA